MKRGGNDLILLLLVIISVAFLSGIIFVKGQTDSKDGRILLCPKPWNSPTITADCGVGYYLNPLDTPEIRGAVSDWQCFHEAPPQATYDSSQRCCLGKSPFAFEILYGIDPQEILDAPNLDIILSQYNDFQLVDAARSAEVYGKGNGCCAESTKSKITWFSENPIDTNSQLCCPVRNKGGSGKIFDDPNKNGQCCYLEFKDSDGLKGNSQANQPASDVIKIEKTIFGNRNDRIYGEMGGQICCQNNLDGNVDLKNSAKYCDVKEDTYEQEVGNNIEIRFSYTECCPVFQEMGNIDSEYIIQCLQDNVCANINQEYFDSVRGIPL